MKNVLSTKHTCGIFLTIIFSLLFSCRIISADPSNGVVYHSVLFGKALALDATNDKLYLAIDSTENLYIYDLDSNGTPLASPAQINDGDNGKALALDSRNQLLYLAGSWAGDSLIVFNLDSDGNTIAPSTHFTDFAFDALAIALNPTEQRLYLGLDGGANSLGVYQIDNSGMPLTSPAPTTSNSGGTIYALAVDSVQQKLYMGCSGEVRVFNLDANGDPTGGYTSFTAGSNDIDTLALDSMQHRLYAASSSANTVYTFTLDAAGEPQVTPAIYDAGGSVYSLCLDATRRIMYVGSGSDFRWFSLDANGDPTGSVSTVSSGSQVRSIAVDAKRQRLYTASFTNSTYFQLTDPPMKPLLVENGAVSVSQQDVAMQWKLPNAKYVMVESSSNLVDFYFPVTYTANTTFDQWIAATGDRWSNNVSVRANTLTVNATLSSGTGPKTINILFWESSGASNDNGVIRRESVSITLSAGGSPTNTPTVSPTPSWTQTHTPTPSITPSWSPTVTLTPSPTPSWTLTASPTPSYTPSVTQTDSPTVSPTMTWTPTTSPTPTWTATIDLSWTPTPTSTASPTLTNSQTPTYTFTVTPSGTPTLTPTPSGTATPVVTDTPTPTETGTTTITPTVTMTPTITRTIPPTATPLPSSEFYLSKNKFNPKKESLHIHFGLRPNENADLAIYSLTGRKIREFGGTHLGQLYVDVHWDGKNTSNDWVASGVYFIVLKTEKRKEIKKVLVVK